MRVENLTRADKEEVVSTLVSAFHDYPVMRYVLKTDGAEYENQLKALVSFFCEVRYARDGHVLGIRESNSLVGAALVDLAIQKPWPQLNEELRRLQQQIGETAFLRLARYEDLTGALEPAEPHYFLGMIGVLPSFRGRGHSGALLRHVKQLSGEDAQSTGVCLSTEDAANVSLYEYFGYRVIAEIDVEELHSWCMFLPTK